MQLIHEVTALRAAIAQYRAQGQRIALVPTMGNLHAGHASLVAQARDSADCVVVSIFVNPLQFGPNEDFDRYPRTLDADCEVLREQGATLVFAPSLEQMYPNGYPPSTTVQVDGALVEQLDGVSRPGHFRGVATVVNILFNLVQPDLAIFGEKDYQQLAVIRRMVADLGLPIEVRGAPTVREADGLARSSRNQYLSAEQRARSSTISPVCSMSPHVCVLAGATLRRWSARLPKCWSSAGFSRTMWRYAHRIWHRRRSKPMAMWCSSRRCSDRRGSSTT